MGITDELRRCILGSNGFCKESLRLDLLAIADRIDVELKRKAADSYMKGTIDGIDMAEHSIEYVKLPVDADDVTIRVGDTVVETDCSVPYLVSSMTLFADGEWEVGDCRMSPNDLHHQHRPTTEDVLREYREKATDILRDYINTNMTIDERTDAEAALDAEYAMRLQLREEDA